MTEKGEEMGEEWKKRERENVLNFGTDLWTPVVILVSEFCEEIETHFFI